MAFEGSGQIRLPTQPNGEQAYVSDLGQCVLMGPEEEAQKTQNWK